MPELNAVDFFRKTRISHPEAIRILITGHTDHRDMIRCINEAAVYQIVPKPWQSDHLLLLVRRALESRELARRHRYLSRELKFADAVLRRQNEGMTKLLRTVTSSTSWCSRATAWPACAISHAKPLRPICRS